MARATINVQALDERNKFASAALSTGMTTAIDATDGAEIVWSERDDKYLVLIQNANASEAKNVTIKAGNGIQGDNDIGIKKNVQMTAHYNMLTPSRHKELQPVSIRFKNVVGADKGKVLFTGDSADIKIAAFKMP